MWMDPGSGQRLKGVCLGLTGHCVPLKCQIHHVCTQLVHFPIEVNLPLTFCDMLSKPIIGEPRLLELRPPPDSESHMNKAVV